MADTRVADLADSGVPDVADLLYLVDVSAGLPRDRKLTIANLADAIGDAIDPTFPPGTSVADHYLSATTTDDTPTPMSPLISIPDDSTIVFVAYIVGRQAGGNSGTYKLEGSLKYDEGGLSLLSGVFKTTFGETNASWDVTFDATASELRFTVTGESADTVEWFAHVHVVEVTV